MHAKLRQGSVLYVATFLLHVAVGTATVLKAR
jgi:hypothetical protein